MFLDPNWFLLDSQTLELLQDFLRISKAFQGIGVVWHHWAQPLLWLGQDMYSGIALHGFEGHVHGMDCRTPLGRVLGRRLDAISVICKIVIKPM